MRCFFFISLFMSAAAAVAAPTVCTYGDMERKIDVVYTTPGHAVPCEVLYDKRQEGGTIETLWRAQGEAGYCETQAEGLVAKLGGFGWQCEAGEEAAAASEPRKSGVQTSAQ